MIRDAKTNIKPSVLAKYLTADPTEIYLFLYTKGGVREVSIPLGRARHVLPLLKVHQVAMI